MHDKLQAERRNMTDLVHSTMTEEKVRTTCSSLLLLWALHPSALRRGCSGRFDSVFLHIIDGRSLGAVAILAPQQILAMRSQETLRAQMQLAYKMGNRKEAERLQRLITPDEPK